jgi:nicotinamidase-related amidase
MSETSPPVLLPIDVQMGFDFQPWGPRWPENMEGQGQRLLQHWRSMGWPVIHVHHASANSRSSLHVSHPGHDFRPGFAPQPGEPLITKNVNSAFIGTDLSDRLEALGRPPLVMFGVSGDMCVSTTARMASNLGYDVTVVSDASWCFDLPGPSGEVIDARTVHAVHMATLAFEFCQVSVTADLLARFSQNAR